MTTSRRSLLKTSAAAAAALSFTGRFTSAQAETVRIGMVGKYVQLSDAYLSVSEALGHAGIHNDARVEIRWVDAEGLDREDAERELDQCDGVLIPGGFGVRGVEGKIRAARFSRENGVPYLGICLGMQVAVSEFARHVAGMDGANSTEFDPETPYPAIDLLPEQKEVRDMGGTMRLGADPVKLHGGTRAREIYGEPVIYERHRGMIHYFRKHHPANPVLDAVASVLIMARAWLMIAMNALRRSPESRA